MKSYFPPELRIRNFNLERSLLTASPWYEKDGESHGGDFGYTVEDDETWG